MDGFEGYLGGKEVKIYLFSVCGVAEKKAVRNDIKIGLGLLGKWCYWEDQVCKTR